MINESRTRQEEIFSSYFSNKLSLILESNQENHRSDISSFFKSLKQDNYYALMGRENTMIPFLSVQDNLLLGISKKNKKNYLNTVDHILIHFKIDKKELSQPANSLNETEQMIYQIIRALALKQNIIIFDSANDSTTFLINLMPLLKKFTRLSGVAVIMVTPNKSIAESSYYDQCLMLNQLF
ncbi:MULTISPECIES: hypothetical protein [Vagococcus]|uniref:Uncharacterized protein n=1 Tax=Vagococcus fluvialis bH819 TaxID=1255619 RepID=A0A1X6WQF9_9ENTE|nr:MULTISPECIES: hypothetical protein [Vagococcus]SLM85886.1 hypothetical protein FM121_07275 [Vagococcus fluvialis bH819]HCM90306.1 hypothetical protein [Vagococcus sp.]